MIAIGWGIQEFSMGWREAQTLFKKKSYGAIKELDHPHTVRCPVSVNIRGGMHTRGAHSLNLPLGMLHMHLSKLTKKSICHKMG